MTPGGGIIQSLRSRSVNLQRRLRGPAAVGITRYHDDLVLPRRHATPAAVEAVVRDGVRAGRQSGPAYGAHHRARLVEDEDRHVGALTQAEGDGGVRLRLSGEC